MKILDRIRLTSAPAAVLIIRLMVGAVFLSEGIQKFVLPAEVGAGRFAKIGFSSPEMLAPFVAIFEISCGSLVLLGLYTRMAVIPLIAIMCVALYATKLPILLSAGFLKMAHESRTDYSMLLGSVFLMIVGAGNASLDAKHGRSAGPYG